MGLDMYLEEKKYIGANYEHREVEGEINITIKGKPLNIPLEKVVSITLDVAYWRKANQIMRWFTRHPDWNEDKQEVELSGKDISALVDLCKLVLADHSKAEQLLPTMEGFFFGGTDYDEYYFSNLKDTIDMLTNIDPTTYYTFSSSW